MFLLCVNNDREQRRAELLASFLARLLGTLCVLVPSSFHHTSLLPRMPQVLDPCDGVMTNFEVAQLLIQQQKRRAEDEAALPLPGARRTSQSSAWSAQQSVSQISEQILAYLNKTPSTSQSHEGITAFLEAVQTFKLTRMEMLSLVNTPPSSFVEVHLLVEECEDRLTVEQQKELITLCQRTL